MKAPAFDYATPSSVAEAVALLAQHSGNAKLISGGQSLMPVLAFRLAAPALLVDTRRIPGLDRIDIDADGVRLGARVRWRDIEDDERLTAAHPLLAAAIRHVAHYQIRNRGTIGGSLAHADPAAELPGIAVTCDAEIHIEGSNGARTIAAGDFFTGPLSTALADDEMIVALRLPSWRADRRWGFEEFARRRGDFALAAVAYHYDLDAEGKVQNAHVGVIGACTRPHRLAAVEALLNGQRINPALIEACGRAAEAALDPTDDLHASADYRRSLYAALLERSLTRNAQTT